MVTTDPKAAEGIQGIEYDWLAVDEMGCVALFSTAGAGYAPGARLHDTDVHKRAVQAVLGLPASTVARFFPDLNPRCINTWRLVAERGLYAYDCNPNGGPYRLIAAPTVPAHVDALPSLVGEVTASLRLALRFERQSAVTDEQLRDL